MSVFVDLIAEVHENINSALFAYSGDRDIKKLTEIAPDLLVPLSNIYNLSSKVEELKKMAESIGTGKLYIERYLSPFFDEDLASKEDYLMNAFIRLKNTLESMMEISEKIQNLDERLEGNAVMLWDNLPGYFPPAEVLSEMEKYRKDETMVFNLPFGTREVSYEDIARISALAGCKPEYLPVIYTALKCISREEFNLFGVLTTEYPCWPLIVVNGPIRHDIGINCGNNCLGVGSHANTMIGRTMMLLIDRYILSIKKTKTGQGTPCQYSYCFGENEEESPWDPLHVERGYDLEESTVTVLGGESPHSTADHVSKKGEDILLTIAKSMISMGSYNVFLGEGDVMLVLGPDHAGFLAEENWSKDDIRNYLYEMARNPIELLEGRGGWGLDEFRTEWAKNFEKVPVVKSPDNILIVVAGGKGRHSSYIPSYGMTKAITMKIDM